MIVCALGIALFCVGRRVAGVLPKGQLPLAMGVAVLLAAPGILYAIYYLHLFDDWSGFVEFRAHRGTEYLAAGAGLLGGLLDPWVRRRFRASSWGLPTLLLVGLSVPFLKSMLTPVDAGTLSDRWENSVCLQSTASTCGPASAATILKFFGTEVTEAELARSAHTSASGTEIWYLMRTLRRLGFETRARTRVTDLDEVRLPAIAGIVNQASGAGHFVAILPGSDGHWLVADPLSGGVAHSPAEASRSIPFSGFFLEVSKPGG